jgi:RNase P/RNase MRP subunit p29
MRRLQDYVMTRRQAKKQQKRPAKKKITGTVIELTAQRIVLKTAKGRFVIQRTASTRVISGTLRRGSTVTLEGTILAGPQPGKRTETGTVIGLTAQLITLDNTSPDPRTWAITRTTSTIVTGMLTGGSKVTVESNVQDWAHLA